MLYSNVWLLLELCSNACKSQVGYAELLDCLHVAGGVDESVSAVGAVHAVCGPGAGCRHSPPYQASKPVHHIIAEP